MDQRTITLPADLVERFETLANQQGRSLDELITELLNSYAPASSNNWALNVALGMEAADIDWIDDPDASVNSRKAYKEYLEEKRKRNQNASDVDG
jgi:metal-responsive CopG/Arc/MetJ family transcriptional regulator